MTHHWKRFWAKPDVEIPLADHGFLYAPTESEWSVLATEELRSFEQISELRCLMLLGEPGMGKSTALTAEAQALAARASNRGDLVLQVDLGSTRNEQVLAERIFGSPEYTAWATSASTLHLFLDGLDEAVLRLGVVADLIMDGLGTADVSRLALRVACRTADRLLDFEARLEALWGNDEFAIFQLAPLRRDDVRQAAADRGQDPDEFIRAVIDRDIVPLAIKPITLSLLLDLTVEPGGMPTSQLEVYRRGLRRLAAEPSERRDRARDTHGQLRTGARLAVAERIAGATLPLDEAVAGTSDVVALAQLAGGTERDHETAVPTPFDVNEDGLREVLGSGLFSGRGDHLGWAHQTYGEFLAARYLVASAEFERQQREIAAIDALVTALAELRDTQG